jgi:hypothetical protein
MHRKTRSREIVSILFLAVSPVARPQAYVQQGQCDRVYFFWETVERFFVPVTRECPSVLGADVHQCDATATATHYPTQEPGRTIKNFVYTPTTFGVSGRSSRNVTPIDGRRKRCIPFKRSFLRIHSRPAFNATTLVQYSKSNVSPVHGRSVADDPPGHGQSQSRTASSVLQTNRWRGKL